MSQLETRLRQYFEEADADGSGKLSKFEVCKVLKKGGCKESVEEITEWFDEIDVNNDDSLTFDEMWTALNKRDPDDVTESDLRSTFKEMDSDGSGFLEVGELRREFSQRGVEDDVVDKILESVDTDNDNKVNFEELLAAWRQHK